MNKKLGTHALRFLLLVSVSTLGIATVGCSQKPLDPKLQVIDCGSGSADKTPYVDTYYGDTRIKQICMPKEEMKAMDGLDCKKPEAAAKLRTCEYADRIQLFADANNKVHMGAPSSGGPSKGITTFSIEPIILSSPSGRSSADDLFQSYTLDSSQLKIPQGFDPINGVSCSRSKGIIHQWDGCGFNFKHGDSDWSFHVGISTGTDGEISESDAVDTVNSWSKYLPLLLEMKDKA